MILCSQTEYVAGRELEDSARYMLEGSMESGRRKFHRILDVPPELPKPPDVLPKRPPPVLFVVLPKAGVVVEPKPIPREDAGKLWIRAGFHGSPAAPAWVKWRACVRETCVEGGTGAKKRGAPTRCITRSESTSERRRALLLVVVLAEATEATSKGHRGGLWCRDEDLWNGLGGQLRKGRRG
jgi:hypothetical protein